ncbi:MAG: hypothetical protein AB1665_00050 [Candidatus Thermoplasmatota archaeon]
MMTLLRIGIDGSSRARVAIAGCGGAGCNVVHSLPKSEGITTIALNSAQERLSALQADVKIRMSMEDARAILTADPRVNLSGRVRAVDALRSALDGMHFATVVTGLGGDSGWESARAGLRECGRMQVPALCTAIVPFGVEGTVRRESALEQARLLRAEGDGLLLLRNDRLSAIAKGLTFARALDVMSCLAALVPLEVSRFVSIEEMRSLRKVLRLSDVLELESLEIPADGGGTALVERLLASPWLQVNPRTITSIFFVLRAGDDLERIERETVHALEAKCPNLECMVSALEAWERRELGIVALLGTHSYG